MVCSESENNPENLWSPSRRRRKGKVGKVCRKGKFQAWNERVKGDVIHFIGQVLFTSSARSAKVTCIQ